MTITLRPTRLLESARTYLLRCTPVLLLFATSCRTVSDSSSASAVQLLRFDPARLSFTLPETGHVFHLHLGDELYHDTGGITKIPPGVRGAVRDATSSFYQPKDLHGGGYAAAESLYRTELADSVLRNTTVQFQPDSGRLLITEDKSDGVPCRRYILYTLLPKGGYRVTYLAPPWKPVFASPALFSGPPDIGLLSGNRARIEGKVMRIDDIDQSPRPFSVGG